MVDLAITIFSLIVLLFSVIVHELAHGYVAYSLGDPTAKYSGRLTLNPLRHLDMFGSIILPLLLFISGSPFLFGWAKPVPVNPNNFSDKKYGDIKVSVAGPLSNFALAIVFGLMIRFMPGLSYIYAPIVFINIWLGIFNLIPIPPLDGSWILFNFFPASMRGAEVFLRQYGFIILFFLIIFGGTFWSGIVDFFFRLLTGFSV